MSVIRVGLTRDFLLPDGSLGFGDIGLNELAKDPRVAAEFLPDVGGELPRAVADEFDALVVLAPSVTATTVAGCRRLALIARFGVGYDNVDVAACTRNDVLLTITPAGVRRPVAVSALAFLLALSHRLPLKDRLTRTGRWSEKLHHMGVGLTGRTLGLIGLGNIGRELVSLAKPLDLRFVAHDPFVSVADAASVGVELLDLEELLRRSDFVCVLCSLTESTRGLLNAERLGWMKPTAFLINVARGPIVDQAALTRALAAGRLAGAALDVFEREPIAPDDPLLDLDNVILAPHAIGWTDELFQGIGRSAMTSVLDAAAGRVPRDVVNREAISSPGLRAKLATLAAR